MKKIHILLFLFIFSFQSITSQVKLSVYSEVSIITAGPGNELFEAFGHSAIRIKDPVLRLDLVYNYGIFDFNAPNFYTNFVKGKLLYKLGRYPFHYFLESYKQDRRWVKQQILNLTQDEKQAFFIYLENNARPENASYLYDPFFNNCASKLRDITTYVLSDRVSFDETVIKDHKSFRMLMNDEIHWNTWGNFGINLALGKKLDRTATSLEYMYLPDFVYNIYRTSSVIKHKQAEPLVKKEETLIDFPEKKQNIGIFNPLLIFSIITLVGLIITYKDFKNKHRSKWLDVLLMLSTGIIGVLIVFLWCFTDHSTTPKNFNFLWAFMPNLFMAFKLVNNKISYWVKHYLLILIILLFLVPILWLLKIQLFPIAVIPFLILLAARYWFLMKSLK